MPKLPNDNKPRRYGQWAGRPNGYPENPDNCVEEVFKNHLFHQCTRKRGHGPGGLYCFQHAQKKAKKKT